MHAISKETTRITAVKMLKTSCVVFMRDCNDLPEIIDYTELTFDNRHDGVEKIIKVLETGVQQEPQKNHLET